MKSNKGITLVALIITIIVLLILAMVSISLIINSGIITKSKTAVDKYSEEEISEQMKLAYAEYQMSRFTDNSEEFSELLKTKLEKTYGEGNVDVISSGDTVVLKVNDNGTSRFYEYNPSTSVSKELQPGISYGGKNPSEIQPGDDITIVTEKFKVFSVSDGKIKAMPYYNITLTDTPVQSANAGTLAFASTSYWSEVEGWNDNPVNNAIDINMTDKYNNVYKNNIQQYIDAYKEELEILGAKEIVVRACKKNEIDLGLSQINEDAIKKEIINPSKIGGFWLGSAVANDANSVWNVLSDGSIKHYHYSDRRCSSNYRNNNTIN